MQSELVAQVRQFNRTVTQRVGALHDAYLSQDRSLGQARVLWEIGPDGTDLRRLRTRLDLDSGYLSRLLRALETAGLVEVSTQDTDGRARTARLTDAGRIERDLLDARSDELATAILTPLTARQRDRLTAAMVEVQRLLEASMVTIEPRDPRHPQARHCLAAYFAELAERFEGGFDIDEAMTAAADDFVAPGGMFLVAVLHGDPVGCGAIKLPVGEPPYLKRMWVAPALRGHGLGRRILGSLEDRARAHGARTVRLETNRVLAEAIAMYTAAGYREVPAFNDERYAHHWYEKALSP